MDDRAVLELNRHRLIAELHLCDRPNSISSLCRADRAQSVTHQESGKQCPWSANEGRGGVCVCVEELPEVLQVAANVWR